MMMLFKDVYWACERNKDFTQSNMIRMLKKVSQLDGKIMADIYGPSGGAASTKLYEHMQSLLEI